MNDRLDALRAHGRSGRGLRALFVLGAAALLCLVSSTGVAAQSRYWTLLTYQSAVTAQDTRDIVDATSWRNVSFEGRSFIRPRLSIGGYAAWNVFYQEQAGTISLGSVDISGRQNRFINSIPLLVTGHYYLGDPQTSTALYLGTGAGAYWIESRVEVGLTSLSESNWHFGLAPEVGAHIPLDAGFGVLLSVRYNHAFESGGISHAYWTFGVGFGGGA